MNSVAVKRAKQTILESRELHECLCFVNSLPYGREDAMLIIFFPPSHDLLALAAQCPRLHKPFMCNISAARPKETSAPRTHPSTALTIIIEGQLQATVASKQIW